MGGLKYLQSPCNVTSSPLDNKWLPAKTYSYIVQIKRDTQSHGAHKRLAVIWTVHILLFLWGRIYETRYHFLKLHKQCRYTIIIITAILDPP